MARAQMHYLSLACYLNSAHAETGPATASKRVSDHKEEESRGLRWRGAPQKDEESCGGCSSSNEDEGDIEERHIFSRQ